ncbi:pyridoxal-phosphate dependent enzyme [Mycolicibacterium palauense]|uniref:pyridoxal-phosphate dependent enzyme n=1 Tax=Mycolicibacterium palauense TaxID=2034511 RepID=UPI001FE8E8F0|nr:pyridoxal-phosphate dependent enzyme [Mycolicibacterium palauense]
MPRHELIPPAGLTDRRGARYRLDQPRWCGDDGSPLMVDPLPGITPADVDTGRQSQWRYADALPCDVGIPVTLGEGRTPIVERSVDGVDVGFKVEGMNPTGSFKDRGVSVMISALRHQGVTEILEDSSGNGGSSVAAYCAAAGIAAQIVVPAGTSPTKTMQSRIHGADVELIEGTRQDVAEEALRRAGTRFYASHNWHPMFLQGVKLIAYDIWEGLGHRAPDVVVIPAGAGSLVLGCAIGFGELLTARQIDAVPRLLAVQPQRCAPLAHAFDRGGLEVSDTACTTTIAEGTAIARPVRGREVLGAIRASGGAVAAVTEEQIRSGVLELASSGLYVEPTSAMVLPALRDFITRGVVGRRDSVVAVLTGSGHKAATAMATLLSQA